MDEGGDERKLQQVLDAYQIGLRRAHERAAAMRRTGAYTADAADGLQPLLLHDVDVLMPQSVWTSSALFA